MGILLYIAVVRTLKDDNILESYFWGMMSYGCFSISSAYVLLESDHWYLEDKNWRDIWCWKDAQEVRMFFWLAIKGKLLTN